MGRHFRPRNGSRGRFLRTPLARVEAPSAIKPFAVPGADGRTVWLNTTANYRDTAVALAMSASLLSSRLIRGTTKTTTVRGLS